MNSNCSNLLDMRNLQEQVKKAFCYQKLFWPFTVWINCSSDLKKFANSRPSASNFKSFSRWLEQFFLTVGQYNFGNKIPNLIKVAGLENPQKSCPTWCCERLQNCFSGSVGTITKSWSGTEFSKSSSCFTCLDFGLLISVSEKNNTF